MDVVDTLQRSYSTTKFWIITALISGSSAILLPEIFNDLKNSEESSDTLWKAALFVIGLFGVCMAPFAVWQHVQRAIFYNWLRDNWSKIDSGIEHPDGYRVDLDTKLVKYSAVFSAILATIGFESRPYVYAHRSAGIAQVSFTLLSAVFGWWYLGGLDGVVSTAKAIYSNIGNKNVFTLRELINK